MTLRRNRTETPETGSPHPPPEPRSGGQGRASRRRPRILTAILGVLLLLAAVYALLALLARPAPEHPFFAQFQRRPLVMAHQGGDGLWPSNTMYAFEHAVALGVDVLEMDVHSTADDVLVVIHDDTVDRTTDGSGAVHDLTLAEVQALDAGYRWTPDEGQTWPYRGQGIRIPALEEVFAAFPGMPMNIEIKQAQPSIAAPLCRLIRDHDMTERVLVVSFHEQATQEFRDVCPEVVTGTTQNEVIALFALSRPFLEAVYSPAAGAMQVPEYRSGLHVLAPRLVDAAHRRGVEVHAWTINEEEDMQRLIDLGVDGIITDYPGRLLRVLGRPSSQ
ncbi:MAG: glycerophosphodiester phosphodiesterase [Anaerolineae bacterium]